MSLDNVSYAMPKRYPQKVKNRELEVLPGNCFQIRLHSDSRYFSTRIHTITRENIYTCGEEASTAIVPTPSIFYLLLQLLFEETRYFVLFSSLVYILLE